MRAAAKAEGAGAAPTASAMPYTQSALRSRKAVLTLTSGRRKRAIASSSARGASSSPPRKQASSSGVEKHE